MVQPVQQYLAMNGKFKNPEVAQSTDLDVSAVLHYILESKEVGSNEGMSFLERRQIAKASFLI